MTRQLLHFNLLLILVLAFFSLNFSYPNFLNQGIDFLNSKFSLNLPHFWQIPFKLGLDLQGGTHLVYEADLSKIKQSEQGEAMSGLRDVLERRVNVFGVKEPLVKVQQIGGHHRLIIELPGVKSVAEAIKMIGKTPYLEFRQERPKEGTDKILAKQKEIQGKSIEEIKKIEDYQLALEDPYFEPTNLTGRYLKHARVDFDQTTFEPEVLLEFNAEGTKIFKELTRKNINKKLAIYIDNVLISAPVVREEIPSGKAQITGSFTVKEAQALARNLNAGALPLPIKLISQKTIGPTLGKISLEKSLKAAAIGFLGIALFMVGFYRLSGVLAVFALSIYAGILLSLFKLIPVTLTLAGIGGAILSVGMAVDANVLIFERMKEEMKKGESFYRAVLEGFRRAWPSIRDSNMTTLIVALIMFSFGTSFVKGFALTLSLGILVSMFSAIFVTKTFLMNFQGTKLEKIKWLWG
ncbi:protein translocase subunit SecD [bacterium]|nr:protein translocase subunit SecD [bacterium]